MTTQVEISRLRAAAAACDPLAVAQSRAGAVREALTRANAASAEALERLLLRATAPEVRVGRARLASAHTRFVQMSCAICYPNLNLRRISAVSAQAKANESAGVSENARAAQQAALAKQADFARDTIARANAASAEVLEKLLLRAKTAEARISIHSLFHSLPSAHDNSVVAVMEAEVAEPLLSSPRARRVDCGRSSLRSIKQRRRLQLGCLGGLCRCVPSPSAHMCLSPFAPTARPLTVAPLHAGLC